MAQILIKYWPILVFIIPTLVAIGIKFGSYTTKLNLVKEFGDRIDKGQAQEITDTKRLIYDLHKEISTNVGNQIKLATDLLISVQGELSTQIKDVSSRVENTNDRINKIEDAYRDDFKELKENLTQYKELSIKNDEQIKEFIRILRLRCEESIEQRSKILCRVVEDYNSR
jgi:uncharacterized phage infection (PIP) family protein YhgE